MRSVLILIVVLLCSCAGAGPARRAVPGVVVRLEWIRSTGAEVAAHRGREVRGELRAAWAGPAPPAPVGAAVVRAPPARSPPPCVSRAICAWERRARTRALARLLAEVGS
jgi:hypothetical protein